MAWAGGSVKMSDLSARAARRRMGAQWASTSPAGADDGDRLEAPPPISLLAVAVRIVPLPVGQAEQAHVGVGAGRERADLPAMPIAAAGVIVTRRRTSLSGTPRCRNLLAVVARS